MPTHSRMQINGRYSEEFDIRAGVHKSSVLSPLLLILVRKAEFHTGGPWELPHADDLVLITETSEECITCLFLMS